VLKSSGLIFQESVGSNISFTIRLPWFDQCFLLLSLGTRIWPVIPQYWSNPNAWKWAHTYNWTQVLPRSSRFTHQQTHPRLSIFTYSQTCPWFGLSHIPSSSKQLHWQKHKHC
jgi:hypothetical protein